MRWENSAYKKYLIRFRIEDDADLIQWIEDHKEVGTTELFRRGLEKLKSEGL